MKKTKLLIALSAALLLASCGDDSSSSGPEGDGSEELSSAEGSSDAGSSAGGNPGGNSDGGSQGGNSQDANSSETVSSSSEDEGDLVWTPVPLQSEITKALPMTGLVLWEDNGK
ncbi:MAG: hypothetical protein J6Z50_04695, partial [Fibrobacterales bacterium]|nr:hypothetical protein [Fibrobacterales bacterium]